jgi:hypothetical protein
MRTYRQRLRRGVSCALVVFATFLTVGAGAAFSNTKGEHCFAPDGSDLNERYGISETIVTFFCPQLRTGEHWTTSALWFVAESYGPVPPEFDLAPGATTPLEDFLAKFVGVRYVIDPGTSQERTYVFPNSDKLWTGVLEFDVGFFLPAVNPLTLGRLHPLSKGQHVIDRYWRFSALHCDGLGDSLADNCLPAGDTFFGRVTFDVVPASKK